MLHISIKGCFLSTFFTVADGGVLYMCIMHTFIQIYVYIVHVNDLKVSIRMMQRNTCT